MFDLFNPRIRDAFDEVFVRPQENQKSRDGRDDGRGHHRRRVDEVRSLDECGDTKRERLHLIAVRHERWPQEIVVDGEECDDTESRDDRFDGREDDFRQHLPLGCTVEISRFLEFLRERAQEVVNEEDAERAGGVRQDERVVRVEQVHAFKQIERREQRHNPRHGQRDDDDGQNDFLARNIETRERIGGEDVDEDDDDRPHERDDRCIDCPLHHVGVRRGGENGPIVLERPLVWEEAGARE